MGIYIKKMEMPESCYYCPFADGVWQKDKRCLINGKEMPRDGRDVQQNHINCPLIPVPPHGDLIDRDALSKSLDRLCDRVCQYSKAQRKMMCGACPLGDAFAVVEDDAPTIIEAEGSE